LGSSVGITKVKAWSGLPAALAAAFRYDPKALVEQGVDCRELECSVLGNEEPRASLPGEVLPAREFYDYEDKYLDGKTGFAVPARLPAGLTARVRRLAVGAFQACACSGLARVDFFLERGTRRLFVNEINTMPGFTEISMYPKLWAATGLPFPALAGRLVELGLEHHRAKKRCVVRTAR
jgi:D-alanine-D-alanine ligase